MQLSQPILPSQRYTSVNDFAYESHHEGAPAGRQPLSESSGNAQPHSLATSTGLCYGQLSFSPPYQSTPTPPILPTQTLTSSYGTSLRGERSLQRNASLQKLPMGHARGRKNPIYHHKNFADYRNKVMQKELDKEDPVWPDWLEEAFLDALLLIPQLGRKKFSSKTILYGRNMLITEYLWTYHWTVHPAKKGERIPCGKDREKTKYQPGHSLYRSRKQVSSHIQVLKGFFPTLPTFHYIFPRQKDTMDEDKKLLKEDEDTESFKNNRVLISIADGRLPTERPNYEYFSRLLNAENDVFIRPKQCWVYVSSHKLNLKEKHVTSEDGTAKKQRTANHPEGICLTETDYPHLKFNESKDYKDLPRLGNRPAVLLHEYTRALAQKESSSVKDIAGRWDVRFPELREKLMAALDDVQPSDERTSRCVVGPCDTFHFETVLDLHATSKFPSGSDLTGSVEFTISRPDLHRHNWRSRTCVIKPEELYVSDGEEEYWEENGTIDVKPAHRVSCTGVGRCDCTARGSRDTIQIPFAANSWASTFVKLAPYVTAERERKERGKAAKAAAEAVAEAVAELASVSGRAEREAARMKKEDAEREVARLKKEIEEASSHPKSRGPAPMDLLGQVAMYQEVWSAPQNEVNARTAGDEPSSKRTRSKWTRRAVILWTFVPVHEVTDSRGKTTIVPPGTNWRFLTKVDPTSAYHQQHAYISGSPATLSRQNVLSPSPGYAQHLNAVMHENFSAAYDSGNSGAFTLPSHNHSHPHLPHLNTQSQLSGLDDMLDGYSNGLATPPPSVTLQSHFPHPFEANNDTNIDSGHTLHHHLSFMSDGTSGTASTTDHGHVGLLAANDLSPTESFFPGLEHSDYMHSFSATTHPLGDLAGPSYLDNSHTTADSGGVSWADTAVTSSAMEPHWAAMAAAATSHGSESQHVDLGGSSQHHDAWSSWPTAEFHGVSPDYSRRTSDSIFEEGLGDLMEGGSSSAGATRFSTLAGRKRSRTENIALDQASGGYL
ncbi:hypothetical protein F4808DRAFT_199360 [Astrocystis sublimbata]|nr:hypothetical protein F4808DRAFT_199360 [Astrocystis sublimbata]